MWQRVEPSPGADVAGVSPVPAQPAARAPILLALRRGPSRTAFQQCPSPCVQRAGRDSGGTQGYSRVLKSGSAASSGVVHRLHAEVVGCASCCMLHPTRHRACRMPRVYRVVSLRQIALIRRVRLLLPRRRGLRPTLRLPHSDRCAGACVPCLSPPPSPAPPRPALSLWTCEPALVRVLWRAAAHTSCASIFCAAAADSCTKRSERLPFPDRPRSAGGTATRANPTQRW